MKHGWLGLWFVAIVGACGGAVQDGNDAGSKCPKGIRYNDDCNTCTCDPATGASGCTTMGCPKDTGTDAADDAPILCPFGTTYRAACNTCTCNPATGLATCTTMDCADAAPDVIFSDLSADVSSDTADATKDSGLDPKCPSTFDLAKVATGDMCALAIKCAYPEGSCSCPGYCGGPPPGPDWKPTWTCVPKPPPRTDGCPDVEPTSGAACTPSGKKCNYGSCCMFVYTCGTTWSKSGPICPP